MTGFKLRSEITDVQVIAAGAGVHVRAKLRKAYGGVRWRKLKGIALIELPDGAVATAELHWYEAHGVGRRDMKVKRLLEWHG